MLRIKFLIFENIFDKVVLEVVVVVSENVFGLLAWAVMFLACSLYLCKISESMKTFWVITGIIVILVFTLLISDNVITNDNTILFQVIDGGIFILH